MATFNFRSLLAATLVAATTMTVAGRTLSANEALNRAVGITATSSRGMMNTNSAASQPELVYTEETEGEATVYVFNRQGGGSYIVAANDAVPNMLLGYTDEGSFDAENMPHNVADMLNNYGEQVAYAAAQNSLVRTQRQSRIARGAVAPILSTRWGMGDKYNAYCPVVNGTNCPAGCVAVAMAQVMYTFGAPTVGTGSISYKPSGLTETLTYDFSANPINWSAITLNPEGRPSSTGSYDAVARLMYACGMSVKMNYSLNGSGSSLTNASRALVETFGYDRGIGMMDRAYYTDQEWDEMLYNELSEGRAVIYSGRTVKNAGHAFVIDGYNTDGYYHVNWGWNGGYNGYFLIDALNPQGESTAYVTGHQMVIGIQPATAENAVRPVVQFGGDLTVDNANVTRTTTGVVKVKSSSGIFNQSVASLHVTLGLHLIGTDGTELYLPSTFSKEWIRGGGTMNFSVQHKEFPTSGRYLATPCVQTADGNWTEISVTNNAERAMYVDCSTKGLVFTPESEMIANESQRDITVSDMAIREGSLRARQSGFGLQANFTNNSYNYYVKSLTPTLMDADGNVVATATQFTVELEALENEMAELDCTLSDHVADGNYTLALVDNKGKTIGQPIAVKVLADELQGVEEIAAETTAAEILTTEIYNAAGRLMATVEGTDTDAANLTAGIYILRHLHADGTTSTTKQAIR